MLQHFLVMVQIKSLINISIELYQLHLSIIRKLISKIYFSIVHQHQILLLFKLMMLIVYLVVIQQIIQEIIELYQ
jgi:hypothetical protein